MIRDSLLLFQTSISKVSRISELMIFHTLVRFQLLSSVSNTAADAKYQNTEGDGIVKTQ